MLPRLEYHVTIIRDGPPADLVLKVEKIKEILMVNENRHAFVS